MNLSWDRVRSIFDAAATLDPAARRGLLDREFPDDSELRQRVEALLVAHDAAAAVLQSRGASVSGIEDPSRTVESTLAHSTSGPLGMQIGPFRLLEKIGEGGFGIVYLAEQSRPIHRKVALKLLRSGPNSNQVLARFDAERQALALMDHPNIATVYDAGVTPSGDPYFVMEYVAGLPITAFADERRMSIDDRLALFSELCDAIQHAHQKGVIHRDLKPSNVLVSVVDQNPHVKVIDFGVAKALGARLTEETLHTQFGVLIGTPEYMSPEQANASVLGVDTRSDVYSLGVILYELLVGALPFDRRDSLAGGVLELMRLIRERDPERLTTRLSALGETAQGIADRRRVEPASLARRLRGDLEWITLKALEKDPARRYQTASALGEDILRMMSNHPILARPPSTAYQLQKLVARHKALFAFAAILAAALVVFSVTMYVMFENQRVERMKAERVAGFLQDMLRAVDPANARGEDVLVREVLDRAAQDVEMDLRDEPEVQGALQRTLANTYRGLGLVEEAVSQAKLAVNAARAAGGSESKEMASALGALGDAYFLRGDADSARTCFEEALKLETRHVGSSSRHAGQLWGGLSICMKALGKLEEAESAAREAVRIARLGREPERETDEGGALNDLAVTLQARGKYAEAETTYRESLEISRRALGEDHPYVPQILLSLGSTLRQQGKYAAAESIYREALPLEIKLLGNEHPVIAATMNNLGLALKSQGRLAEAESLYGESLAMRRKIYSGDHAEIATSLNNLGGVMSAAGKYSEAETYYRESLAMTKRLSRENTPEYARTLNNLAGVYDSQGRHAEAEKLGREALRIRREVLGDSHPDVNESVRGVSWDLLRMGRPREAEALLREQLAVLAANPPEDDGEEAILLATLGKSVFELGRVHEAESLYVESLPRVMRSSWVRQSNKEVALAEAIKAFERSGDAKRAASTRAALDSLVALAN